MKPMDLGEIQQSLLEMLKAFDRYCSDHELVYFLDSGTLLGAIRHQGFIPWDDDVDISMKRTDFMGLIALAENNPYIDEQHRYKVLPPISEANMYPFIKIIDTKTLVMEADVEDLPPTGLWLDVFCFDPLFENNRKQNRLLRKRERYRIEFFFLTVGNPINWKVKLVMPVAKIIKPLLKLTGKTPEETLKKIWDLSLQGPETSSRIGNIAWCTGKEDRYESSWYDHPVRTPFEDTFLNVPNGYINILKAQYGDYEKIPPEHERRIHNASAFMLD